MLTWKKLGNVFNPARNPTRPWMQAYTQCPFPMILNENTVRVYFATRGARSTDMQYVSYPAYVDLARDNLHRVMHIAEEPLFGLGGPGTFDEFGITPSSFVKRGNRVYGYYTGWSRLRSVPYTLAIGLAVSWDGGDRFEKAGEGPILGATLREPLFASGPIVRLIGDSWHMWYITGRKWLSHEGKFESVYQIVHATSDDGISWARDGKSIIPMRFEDECQVSLAPFFKNDRWHAVFAYRRPTDFRTNSQRAYRLGYVSSADLKNWERDDSMVGIDVSASGWDSEMLCYPQIAEVDERILMFYCGNDFGREGFGIAELEGLR